MHGIDSARRYECSSKEIVSASARCLQSRQSPGVVRLSGISEVLDFNLLIVTINQLISFEVTVKVELPDDVHSGRELDVEKCKASFKEL